VCTITIWAAVYTEAPSGVLTVAMMDVGQGDAIYIESPTGVQIVVDGGPDGSLLRELPLVMPFFDRSLDAALQTHPDADHIGGFIDLLRRYEVGIFVEPGIVKTTQTALTLEQEILAAQIPRYLVRRGTLLDLGGGAVLEILYPDSDVTYMDRNASNEGGVVARLRYGETSVLLMADVSQKVETRLMELTDNPAEELQSDILKVGHHGSKTSTSQNFLSVVRPGYALISVGAKNSYHHPTEETLGRLAAVGATILRTDQEGTILFRSDGTRLWRVE